MILGLGLERDGKDIDMEGNHEADDSDYHQNDGDMLDHSDFEEEIEKPSNKKRKTRISAAGQSSTYACQLCDKKYKFRNSLNIHTRIHHSLSGKIITTC